MPPAWAAIILRIPSPTLAVLGPDVPAAVVAYAVAFQPDDGIGRAVRESPRDAGRPAAIGAVPVSVGVSRAGFRTAEDESLNRAPKESDWKYAFLRNSFQPGLLLDCNVRDIGVLGTTIVPHDNSDRVARASGDAVKVYVPIGRT